MMPLVAVTRLRLRSLRFLVPFAWYTWRSFEQAKHARGNLGVKLRKAEGITFWTLTAWQDEAAMSRYRITPPHRHAMAKLPEWCGLGRALEPGRSCRTGRQRKGEWLMSVAYPK